MQTAIPSATQSTTGPHPHAGRPFTLAAPMGGAHGHSKQASTVSQTANKKADTAMHNRGIGAKPRTLALARTRRGAVWSSKECVGEVFISSCFSSDHRRPRGFKSAIRDAFKLILALFRHVTAPVIQARNLYPEHRRELRFPAKVSNCVLSFHVYILGMPTFCCQGIPNLFSSSLF